MGRRHNWVQLVKFGVVGGSGYVVNLAVFAAAVKLADVHHLVAATIAFVVAVTNNFWWNRHWTFGARDGHAGFQAARFFSVSVGAFLFGAAILELLVNVAGVPGDRGPGHVDRGRDAAELRREQDVELRTDAPGLLTPPGRRPGAGPGVRGVAGARPGRRGRHARAEGAGLVHAARRRATG